MACADAFTDRVAGLGDPRGARSFTAIGEWAAELSGQQLARPGLAAAPDKSTLRKLFARLDANALDRVLGAWWWTRTKVISGQQIIAIDGKAVRGAKDAQGQMPHLVATLDHHSGAVLGQLAVAAKSNEIPRVRELLADFNLADTVVTVNAMHTQTDTATAITGAGGDYVFTVKANTTHAAGQAQGPAVAGRARPLGHRHRPWQTDQAHH